MRVRTFAVVLLLSLTSGARAGVVTANVTVDATVTATRTIQATVSEALVPWVGWARMDKVVPFAPAVPADSAVSGWAARQPGAVGAALTNAGEEAARVRVSLRLGPGLWRLEAALVDKEAASPRTWRMESVLQSGAGPAVKQMMIPAGHTLFLRITNTVAAARAAFRSAVAAKEQAQTDFLKGRVARPLNPIGGALGTIGALVLRGKRDEVARKAHRALLAAAQAQAVWKNGRSGELAPQDAVFADLMTALSEVSLAACNLVPSQTRTTAADGAPALQVSVTNAGRRTVPLVSLGVDAVAGDPRVLEATSLGVFRSLAPGEKVTKTFRVDSAGMRGVVQFVQGMGAAAVPAAPLP